MDIVVDVLKWVIIILIAGFIGQFGKSLSVHIIDYYKKKRQKCESADLLVSKEKEKKPIVSSKEMDYTTEKEGSIVPPEKGSQIAREVISTSQKRDSKIEKKAIKTQQKAQKKMEKKK